MITFFITTYTSFSHNVVIAYLSSNDAQYIYDVIQTEQCYSRFKVTASKQLFLTLRDLNNQKDGVSFTLEYGAN